MQDSKEAPSSSIQKIKKLLGPEEEMKRDLSFILAQFDPTKPREAQLETLTMLRSWLMAPLSEGQRAPATRLRFILQVLDRNPIWTQNLSACIAGLLLSCQAFSGFAHMGLFEEKGFADQLASLALDRVLPLPRSPLDFAEWLEKLFPHRDDAELLESIPAPLLREFFQLISQRSGEDRLWKNLRRDMLLAMQHLGLQIASMGTSRSLWVRLGSPNIEQMPFWRLQDAVRDLVAPLLDDPTKVASGDQISSALVELRACELAMNNAFEYLRTHGVNSGLVLRLEHILNHMRRLRLCLHQVEANRTGEGLAHGQKVLGELIRDQFDSVNLKQLLKGNLQMLSLRVVEHTGTSGDHYITRNRSEYFSMLRSAAGGGVMTVGTTILKYAISAIGAPVFVDAILHGLNYSISFLTMQAFHFTLATKQPSMTASALARKVAQSTGPNAALAIAVEIRSIVRSQMASIAGNLGLAVPTALLLAFVFQWAQGAPLFDKEYANYTLHSLHPIRTLTLFYAVQTGFLLWLSSLIAGWVENWLAFQNVPERISGSRRVKRAFGPEAGPRIAGFLARNISGITGSVALGVLLALHPFLGKVTGLPLDIRHVTLSAASLAISAVSLGRDLPLSELLAGTIGVLCIGALNFSVSFALALNVARYAQGINGRRMLTIRSRVTQLFRWQPLAFFFPLAAAEEETQEFKDKET